MRGHRLTLRLLVPAGLILLVLLLGALQYRWLGQVSEAERAQLQRSLSQRAVEFGAEFDREIALAYELLTIDSSVLDADPWPAVADRYDTWRARALYPDIVRAIYIARSAGGSHSLQRWSPETRTGDATDWPAHFEPVQHALRLSMPRTAPATAPGNLLVGAAAFTLSLSPVVDTVPALVLPIVTQMRQTGAGQDVTIALRTAGTDFVVVELDRDVLTQTMIPSLVERFFPSDDANQYRVAVVDRSRAFLFDRGLSATVEGEREHHLDATATFFTGARLQVTGRMASESRALTWQVESLRRATTTAIAARTPVPAAGDLPVPPVPLPAPAGGTVSIFVQEHVAPMPAAQNVRMALTGWQIMLQHGAGSLDEAVARARHRNLATSFGILGVLVIGVGLIVANARKSEALAARQMEFVATVTHELRTPLAVIRSAAQNLSAGVVGDPAQARRYGDLIETEGRRLTDMVEDVLEFAGLSGNRRPLALRPVDLAWLAGDVLSTQAGSLASLGITAEVAADEELPTIMGDEEALRRALNNLVGNAAKYAADGHWLGVRLSRQRRDGRDEVHIAVSDRGPGIASEDLPHLFEPFYRGREVMARQIHGHGLGLSLVSRIAEAHRGSVVVSSEPGAGATFTLRLPVDAA